MSTEYTPLEPSGFGQQPFGNPDSEDKEFRKGGFGDPTTIYTEYTHD